jgi:Holliday junction resolvase RusA-like endonuclease
MGVPMIQIQIYGNPFPWTAARVCKNGHHYDPKSKEKEALRWQIKGQYRDPPVSGPVHIDITFYMPIPKSTSAAQRRQMRCGKILHVKKPDTSNLFKAYEDALKGIVIDDDNRSQRISACKVYSETPGALIRVRPLTPYGTLEDYYDAVDQI